MDLSVDPDVTHPAGHLSEGITAKRKAQISQDSHQDGMFPILVHDLASTHAHRPLKPFLSRLIETLIHRAKFRSICDVFPSYSHRNS
jgi:hypothetical protein